MDHSAVKACLATLRRSVSYDRLIESYVMAVRSRFSCWMFGLGVSMIMALNSGRMACCWRIFTGTGAVQCLRGCYILPNVGPICHARK
jgi:hypothetical protein